jgi:hypothetical protein
VPGVRGVKLARPRALAGLAGAVLLVAALAGCGGSSATTKAQWITKVNAICATEYEELFRVAQSQASYNTRVDEANATRERADAKLVTVKAPKSEAITPEWLLLRQRALVAGKRFAAAKQGSREQEALDVEIAELNNHALQIAKAYGLTECKSFAAT